MCWTTCCELMRSAARVAFSFPEQHTETSLSVTRVDRPIDGNDDGQPGGDYIATISGTRVTIGGLPLARTYAEPTTVPDAIDALLARGELTGPHVTRARARALGRHDRSGRLLEYLPRIDEVRGAGPTLRSLTRPRG